jgi:hypothetical protein
MPLHTSEKPNDIWAVDFKGQFRTSDRRYCYPLTVTDHFSRFVLSCDALESTKGEPARCALRMVFKEYGMPARMRSDNGAPFASTGLAGLSRLSVWLMRLGIELERIAPGHPEQNGRHERMHRDLKAEATKPPGKNLLHQQERFDEFRATFNEIRPHEALGMRKPAEVYTPSTRRYADPEDDIAYPLHHYVARVQTNGDIYLPTSGAPRVYVSEALAHAQVGLRHLGDATWLLSFMHLDLGYLDEASRKFLPLPAASLDLDDKHADRDDRLVPNDRPHDDNPDGSAA